MNLVFSNKLKLVIKDIIFYFSVFLKTLPNLLKIKHMQLDIPIVFREKYKNLKTQVTDLTLLWCNKLSHYHSDNCDENEISAFSHFDLLEIIPPSLQCEDSTLAKSSKNLLVIWSASRNGTYQLYGDKKFNVTQR